MPKKAITGTQYKAQKFAVKSQVAREKAALPIYKDLLKGKHGPTTDLSSLIKDFERAGRGAADIYAPIKEQAVSDFQTSTLPAITQAYGSDVKTSSALRQALSAAGSNLQRSLASDFAGLQSNLAQNLLGQREQNKTNQMSMLSGLTSGISQGLQSGTFSSPYQQKAPQGGNNWGSAIGGIAEGGGKAYAAWQLAKLAAAAPTGGASLAIPV